MVSARRLLAGVFLVALGYAHGCDRANQLAATGAPRGDDSQPSPPEATMVRGIYYSEPGAPHPVRCQADRDCIGDALPNATGCCVTDSTPRPQSRAYRTWLMQRRSTEACRQRRCPVISPSPPRDCEIRVRCVQNECRNAC